MFYIRVKNDARASTEAMPRRLGASSFSLILLVHEALTTIASVPDARGEGAAA